MKKLFAIYILFLVVVTTAYCQSSIGLDSLFLTTRDPDLGLYRALPDSSNKWTSQLELNVAFYMSDTTQLDTIEVRYGTAQGLSDILDLNLVPVMVNGKPYLACNGKQYPIYSNYKVYVTCMIPEYTLLDGADYVWVRAKDKKGNYTNILQDVN